MELSVTAKLNEMARKMIENIKKAKSERKDLAAFTASGLESEFPTFTLGELNEYAAKLETKDGHLFSANDIFGALPDIAECIQKMSFTILKAPPDLFFLTCDRPLVLQSSISGTRVGAGWGKSDAVGSIVLCPEKLLIMYYGKSQRIDLKETTSNHMVELNLDTIKFADLEVYSPSEYSEADNWMKGLGRWSPKG